MTLDPDLDSDGNITGGTAGFEVELKFDAPVTVTGLQLKRASAVLDSGLSAGNPFASDTGTGHFSHSEKITEADGSALAVLRGLKDDPAALVLVLRTLGDPGDLLQSPLLPVTVYVPYLAQGEKHVSTIYVTNPSASSDAHALLKLYDGFGIPVSASASSQLAHLRVPPSGAVPFTVTGSNVLSAAYAHIYSDLPVAAEVAYSSPAQSGSAHVKCALAHSVSFPVSFDPERNQNTRIAVIATPETGTQLAYSLTDNSGAEIPGASNSIDLLYGKQMTILVSDLIPSLAARAFKGRLTMERRWASFSAGRMAVIALQYDKDIITPLPITVVRP